MKGLVRLSTWELALITRLFNQIFRAFQPEAVARLEPTNQSARSSENGETGGRTHMSGVKENIEHASFVKTEAPSCPARLSECELAVVPLSPHGPLHSVETEQRVELAQAIGTEKAIGPARLTESETTIGMQSPAEFPGGTAESTVGLLESYRRSERLERSVSGHAGAATRVTSAQI